MAPEPETPEVVRVLAIRAAQSEEQLVILTSRLDLLVIDVRELLTIMKDEPALVARRPHLAREMAIIEARLKSWGNTRGSQADPWWKRAWRELRDK